MKTQTVSQNEFDRYARAANATIKRVVAENTWLRHNFNQLEARVTTLKKDITTLKTAATKLNKALGSPIPSQDTTTRSST